jgi:orotate phosphoribosyltransferase-like protein
VHFDNARIHSSRGVTEKLIGEALEGVPHAAEIAALFPCDFFVFGDLKDKLVDKRYATPEELFTGVDMIISEMPSDMISQFFLTW